MPVSCLFLHVVLRTGEIWCVGRGMVVEKRDTWRFGGDHRRGRGKGKSGRIRSILGEKTLGSPIFVMYPRGPLRSPDLLKCTAGTTSGPPGSVSSAACNADKSGSGRDSSARSINTLFAAQGELMVSDGATKNEGMQRAGYP